MSNTVILETTKDLDSDRVKTDYVLIELTQEDARTRLSRMCKVGNLQGNMDDVYSVNFWGTLSKIKCISCINLEGLSCKGGYDSAYTAIKQCNAGFAVVERDFNDVSCVGITEVGGKDKCPMEEVFPNAVSWSIREGSHRVDTVDLPKEIFRLVALGAE